MNADPRWGVLTDRQMLAAPMLAPLQELVTYWREKCSPHGLPRRSDILPAEIPKLLPYLSIMEPVDGGADWVYRLVGTQLASRYGFDWTGRRLSTLLNERDEAADAVIRFYSKVAADGVPSFVSGRIVMKGRDHIVYECGLLPILGRDERTRWILLGVFFRN